MGGAVVYLRALFASALDGVSQLHTSATLPEVEKPPGSIE
jgi:hypothetical protein